MLDDDETVRHACVGEVDAHVPGVSHGDVGEQRGVASPDGHLERGGTGAGHEANQDGVPCSVHGAVDVAAVRGRSAGAVQGVVWGSVQRGHDVGDDIAHADEGRRGPGPGSGGGGSGSQGGGSGLGTLLVEGPAARLRGEAWH